MISEIPKAGRSLTKNYVLALSQTAIGINWGAAMELDNGLSELEPSPTPGVAFAAFSLPSGAEHGMGKGLC